MPFAPLKDFGVVCDDLTMKHFLVKTIANAAALAVAIWLLKDITLTGENTGRKILTLVLVALIFGLVNFIVKPDTMQVMDSVQGFEQTIHDHAMMLCGQ